MIYTFWLFHGKELINVKICNHHNLIGPFFLQSLSSSNVAARSHDEASEINSMKSTTVLKVTLLGSEWSSSMGGLSTINRQLAILLAKHSEVDVTLLVPQFACSDDERRMASSHNVSIQEAEKLAGFSDPLEWLSFPPRDLDIDFVLGHGAKLGKQAQVIRKSHNCKWIQVVHTAPEELGMHKNYPMAISKGEDKTTTEVEMSVGRCCGSSWTKVDDGLLFPPALMREAPRYNSTDTKHIQ